MCKIDTNLRLDLRDVVRVAQFRRLGYYFFLLPPQHRLELYREDVSGTNSTLPDCNQASSIWGNTSDTIQVPANSSVAEAGRPDIPWHCERCVTENTDCSCGVARL